MEKDGGVVVVVVKIIFTTRNETNVCAMMRAAYTILLL